MMNVIRDGETYNHKELAPVFGFTDLTSFKNWVKRNNIAYAPVNGIWWIAGEDARLALRMGLVHDKGSKGESE